jgi:hypothetical protein
MHTDCKWLTLAQHALRRSRIDGERGKPESNARRPAQNFRVVAVPLGDFHRFDAYFAPFVNTLGTEYFHV